MSIKPLKLTAAGFCDAGGFGPKRGVVALRAAAAAERPIVRLRAGLVVRSPNADGVEERTLSRVLLQP